MDKATDFSEIITFCVDLNNKCLLNVVYQKSTKAVRKQHIAPPKIINNYQRCVICKTKSHRDSNVSKVCTGRRLLWTVGSTKNKRPLFVLNVIFLSAFINDDLSIFKNKNMRIILCFIQNLNFSMMLKHNCGLSTSINYFFCASHGSVLYVIIFMYTKRPTTKTKYQWYITSKARLELFMSTT